MKEKSKSIKIGQRFGEWVVIGTFFKEKRGEGRGANYITLYPCRCFCGTKRNVRAFKLLSNSKSCGCKTGAFKAKTSTKHGENRRGARSRLYCIWDGMKQRCGNRKHESYSGYGGSGIKVCREWREFSGFQKWAKESGYSDQYQIDRINGKLGYFPKNCRWTTTHTQARNKINVIYIDAFGERKCLTDWGLDRRCNVRPQTIWRRIKIMKWEPEKAITHPRSNKKSFPRFSGNHSN